MKEDWKIKPHTFKFRYGDDDEKGGCTFIGGSWEDVTTDDLFKGKKVVLFMAKRSPDKYHEYQKRGMDLGAIYEWVNMGMLSVTKSRAKKYYEEDPDNRVLFPIGLEHPTVVGSIIKVARQNLNENDFSEIWSRGLQLAFPNKDVHVVSVGHTMSEREIGRAKFYRSDYKFDKIVKEEDMPPFPSAPTYDAKAWKFVKEHAKPNALFWNVAG